MTTLAEAKKKFGGRLAEIDAMTGADLAAQKLGALETFRDDLYTFGRAYEMAALQHEEPLPWKRAALRGLAMVVLAPFGLSITAKVIVQAPAPTADIVAQRKKNKDALFSYLDAQDKDAAERERTLVAADHASIRDSALFGELYKKERVRTLFRQYASSPPMIVKRLGDLTLEQPPSPK